MRRLGYLARHAFTTHSGVLDAQQYTAALPVCARGAELCITSRRYLRRMCCTFLILMRTLHVARESVLAADLPPEEVSTAFPKSTQSAHLPHAAPELLLRRPRASRRASASTM